MSQIKLFFSHAGMQEEEVASVLKYYQVGHHNIS